MRAPIYPVLAAVVAAKGLTQAELARAVGITHGNVSNIIRGQLKPSKALRARFAEVLEIDEDALFALNPDVERLLDQVTAQGFGRVAEDPNVLRQLVASAGEASA